MLMNKKNKKYVLAYRIKGTDEIRLFKMTKQCVADFSYSLDDDVRHDLLMYKADEFIDVYKSKPVTIFYNQFIRASGNKFTNLAKGRDYNCKLYSLVMGNGLCKLLTGENRTDKRMEELFEDNRIEQRKQLALETNECIIKWNKYAEAIGDNLDLFNKIFAILDDEGVKIC